MHRHARASFHAGPESARNPEIATPARAVPGAIALLALFLLFGCGSGDDPKVDKAKKESREAFDALEELARDRARRFFDAMRDDFGDLDEKLAKMRDDASRMSGAARERAQDLLEKAEAERKILAAKLAEMRNAAGEDIARLQEDLKVAYEAAEEALRQARAERDGEADSAPDTDR